ncbi:EscF/YscF/HrpA family type III secretion system needle major subunit [Desulfothermus sp.]
MTLNLDNIYNKLGEATTSIEDEIAQHLETMDSSNTTDVLKLQQLMQKWSIATQVQSNTLKTIGEGIKSTVQNIR